MLPVAGGSQAVLPWCFEPALSPRAAAATRAAGAAPPRRRTGCGSTGRRRRWPTAGGRPGLSQNRQARSTRCLAAVVQGRHRPRADRVPRVTRAAAATKLARVFTWLKMQVGGYGQHPADYIRRLHGGSSAVGGAKDLCGNNFSSPTALRLELPPGLQPAETGGDSGGSVSSG